jgi:hypothetical protein
MWNKTDLIGALVACLLLFSGTVLANDRVQVHGFFSQAAVHTDANDVGGNSEDGVGLDMREAGVNLSYRPDVDWLFSGQALARWAGSSDEGDLRVDYAFADRTLSSDETHRLGIQIGKVKNPFGLYNTTRDVAHTRSGILLPQSVYVDELRNTFLAAPGISINGNQYFENASFEWTFNLIRPEVDARALTRYMITNYPGHFEGEKSWLAQGLWEQDGGRWRLGLTLGNIQMRYKPSAPFPVDLGPGHIALHTGVLSMEHHREKWSLMAEYALTKQARDGFVSIIPNHILDRDTVVEGAYLQGVWRFAPRWQSYARYETLYLDRADKNGQVFQSLSGGGIPATQRFSRDKVIGVRYDPNISWALSAEYHDVDGTAWLPRIDNPAAQMQQRWNMLLLQAAYRF